jgi:hypothetical protein
MNQTVPDLVLLARQALAAGDRERAAVCLRAALQLEPADLAAHNLREEEKLPDFMSGWTGVDARISRATRPRLIPCAITSQMAGAHSAS